MKKSEKIAKQALRDQYTASIGLYRDAILAQKTIPESVINGSANVARKWMEARADALEMAKFPVRSRSVKFLTKFHFELRRAAINCHAAQN